MSKARISFAIIGLACAMGFAGPALSQDTGFYAGISFGQSSADVECNPLDSCDDEDTAWKILGGYRFNRNLAIEVGYTDLGEASASRPAGTTVTFESTAFDVVGVGSLPVADRFSVHGKIGFYRSDTDRNDTAGGAGSASDSNTGLTFGVGGQYDFTKNLGIRGEWQRYTDVGGDNVGESDVDVISVGVIWKF